MITGRSRWATASIAVIGSGNLARKWAARSHQSAFGARDPTSPSSFQLTRDIAAASESVNEAAEHADVVVFAVPDGAMADTVWPVGTLFDGKVVIDATNNIRAERPDSRAVIAAAAPDAA